MFHYFRSCRLAFLGVAILFALPAVAQVQQAYYIDGYHGGVWGHYPDWNTRFMVDQLNKHPDWNINIEIEPETWDRAKQVDAAAYNEFRELFANQSTNARIEYVNPSYGQSYLFNISGESIIRQFQYGMKKIKAHFPDAVFSSYSTEEPCFTSALPGILRSFGITFASLKNPNTCFGGYTRAYGGELVNWTGPDGTAILTSPRYGVERLSDSSTWQTIAWNNSPEYVAAAYKYGIKHPVGMTLQDAGWKGGPFLGDGNHAKVKSIYTTWRNYYNIVKEDAAPAWRVSQEDILVSLVWGSQVTQRIAQQVRLNENALIHAEKLAALAGIYAGFSWPQQRFNTAWRNLLLAQHHDCWIVPYNGKKGDTWADKVAAWTSDSRRISDSIGLAAMTALNEGESAGSYITVFNTTGTEREEIVKVLLPGSDDRPRTLTDPNGHSIAFQWSPADHSILFRAKVPAMGNAVYMLKPGKTSLSRAITSVQRNEKGYLLKSDLYSIQIDTAHGGVITSLVAHQLKNKEFVDAQHPRFFNELRGNFYNKGGMHSSADHPVTVDILEAGPLQIKLRLNGAIAGTAYTQTISLSAGSPLVDMQLHIDWKENTGIGQPMEPGTYKWELPRKPFYNDSCKLLLLFPLALEQQHLSKDAPFDITESRLNNTFFNSWDSIKNNVILNWADATDGNTKYGLSIFTDHTTSYTHGEHFPLGLNVQYSGMGLWGRNYTIDGPTDIHYALLPHAGNWENGNVVMMNQRWNEPLTGIISTHRGKVHSLFSIANPAVQVTAVTSEGEDMEIRLFNASATAQDAGLLLTGKPSVVELTELDGRIKDKLVVKDKGKVSIVMPPFAVRTVKLRL